MFEIGTNGNETLHRFRTPKEAPDKCIQFLDENGICGPLITDLGKLDSGGRSILSMAMQAKETNKNDKKCEPGYH